MDTNGLGEKTPAWRCEACRWWQGEGYRGYGKCERIGSDLTSSEAAVIEAVHFRDDHTEPPLLTLAAFGCVLWEGKDTG